MPKITCILHSAVYQCTPTYFAASFQKTDRQFANYTGGDRRQAQKVISVKSSNDGLRVTVWGHGMIED
ncbi:MAG: hypothetical protein GDA56_09055 [Hormoscilla sp. GM7CHS1pb]|nr:hypothetical protein [Hormoscilla sp. GM7CHS1pb]